jgi:carbamoyltransferase
MYTLGLNAAFHDSSAAIVRDGVPMAAAEEERFSRIKHGKRPVPFTSYQLPFHAIDYCLREAGIGLRDVDRIAYSFDPAIALDGRDPSTLALPLEPSRDRGIGASYPWEPLFLAGIINAPRFLVADAPHHLKRVVRDVASVDDLPPFEFVEHHLAHAASAYYGSGFAEAAILTIDGRGELATTLHAAGHGASIEKVEEVRYPHSLGLLYEHVTEYLGFLRSSDEYKVMALASDGGDRYIDLFREMVRVSEDGRYTVTFADLVSACGAPREPGGAIEQRHLDVAAGVQRVLEETVLSLARWLHARTRLDALCLAGGVALNCVMNARIRDEGPFAQMFVQPAAGDAGTALGAASFVDARQRGVATPWKMTHAYLGPEFSDDDIRAALARAKLPYTEPPDIADAVAELLTEDRIVGWYQGRMEFGPRALGARSILASPAGPAMKDRLNAIKGREEFRPVAPAVLEERCADYFEPAAPSPFMLFITNVRPEAAGSIPAVRHVDGTARIQTVSPEHAPAFHALIEAFARRTGVPVIVNTSFNTAGRPIVCTPEDAIECFASSPLDALAMGPFLVRKTPAPP